MQWSRARSRCTVQAMLVAESAVDGFMAGHFAGRAADVRPLAAGEWSRAHAFVLDGRQAVIRFGDHVDDFRKDQVMAVRSSAGSRSMTWTEPGCGLSCHACWLPLTPCRLLTAGATGCARRSPATPPLRGQLVRYRLQCDPGKPMI